MAQTEVHLSARKSPRGNIKVELYKMEYKYVKDLEKNFQEFEKFFVRLAALGSPISKTKNFIHLLRYLPDSFSHIISMDGPMKLIYNKIISSILGEIDRRSNKIGPSNITQADKPQLGARSEKA